MATPHDDLDEVGYWSEVKLDIIRDYATAYSRILTVQRSPALDHAYIDGFAGAGVHWSKSTGDFIAGSPLNALRVDPPFKRVFLVDLSANRVDQLRALVGDRSDVELFHGDCNDVLLNDVFPRVRYDRYQRALCVLDPYGMHLDWRVLEAAAKSKVIDIFLNFPTMDMNMNALRGDGPTAEGERRMTAFWGDDSWKKVAFVEQGDLFGAPSQQKTTTNAAFARAFKTRLQKVAGFKNVLDPMPMRNTIGRVVYYLFFASANDTANKIVKSIFKKHENRRS